MEKIKSNDIVDIEWNMAMVMAYRSGQPIINNLKTVYSTVLNSASFSTS